jgi:hypothetical protein
VSRIFLRLNGLPTPDPARAPALERPLARAAAPLPEPDWRSAAFDLVATPGATRPGIAAAALFAERGPLEAGSVWLADPVHCAAGLVSVRLPANGRLRLTPGEAAQLAADFNAESTSGTARLLAGAAGRLYCLVAHPVTAATHDPQRVAGRDIGDYLPAGVAGAPLRRLMSELEMWLHDHVLNGQRRARGELPVTGLWLWGGGAPLRALPSLTGWTAGSDPLFSAWPGAEAFPAQPGDGVIVVESEPGGDGWPAAQAAWVGPALDALRRGRIAELQLSLGEQRFRLRRGDLLRCWRRARPWWESLG